MNDYNMLESHLGRVLASTYAKLPRARRLLPLVTRHEGGQMTSISLRTILSTHYGVEVGNYSYGSLLEPGAADRNTTIGAYVSIGPGVRRFGAAHPLDDLCLHPYWYNPKLGFASPNLDVTRSACWIGHGSWIGAGAIILPGCRRIGIGAVIGAGSVVTRDVDDFAVVAGNPARTKKLRLSEEDRRLLLSTRHWEYAPEEAHRLLQSIRRNEP
jgi:acetyltransferase-like isoleucine patch superfamily enzyme